ncbi:MAG: rRNA ((1518)-N(6)/adenine(1519)-N(6))-dimethyltransferase RsmA [Bacteroidota bacterium]
MLKVKAKKHLGQHFLTDQGIAMDIVGLLSLHGNYTKVLEIGPGMGVLTQFLIKNDTYETWAIDIDIESIVYLKKHFPSLENRIIDGDFLRMSSNDLFQQEKFAIIGNFPYNISSVIFFKILEEMRGEVTEIVCMLQKEVAERLASPAGNKDYGILSVFLQAYYDIAYCFTVQEHVFDPPPKVKSGVIRLKRNDRVTLDCDEKLFKRVVKQAFTNRRKTLRNTLKPMNLGPEFAADAFFDRRAETLSVEEYIVLTNTIAKLI